MKKGTCPKCQSANVFSKEEEGLGVWGSAYGVNVRAKHPMKLTTCLCADCGYIELYSSDQSNDRKKLGRSEVLKLGEGWQKVTK